MLPVSRSGKWQSFALRIGKLRKIKNVKFKMSKIKKPEEWMLELIKENFVYDWDTGVVHGVNVQNVGYVAKSNSRYFWKIAVRGRRIKRSHIAWFLYYGLWPELEIDHEDRDSLNDRIGNLRQVTPSKQQWNKGNNTGYRGFSVDYTKDKFRNKSIRVRNKNRSIELGYYARVDQAIAAIDEYWIEEGKKGHWCEF